MLTIPLGLAADLRVAPGCLSCAAAATAASAAFTLLTPARSVADAAGSLCCSSHVQQMQCVSVV
jgi:hypothetical protein